MPNRERLIREFLQLVTIDSESTNEREIADYLVHKFQSLGVEIFEDASASQTGHGAGNLFAFIAGDASIEPLLLNAHMDTVTDGNGVQPQIVDEVIYSDGTTILGADDKTGIVAIIELVHMLKEQSLPHGDIQIIFTVGEEVGLIGAKAIDQSLLKAQFGYALDTGGKIGGMKTSAPAAAEIRAEIRGITAHAGVAPEKGISAITLAAKAIAKMPLGRLDFETTANIGTFLGQGPTNIVNDVVEIVGEVRSFNPEKLQNQLNVMTQIFEDTAKELGGQAEVSVEVNFPSFKLTDNSTVVEIVRAAAIRVNRPFASFAAGGGSDANVFNGLGVEMGVLACGYENIHTKNESMPIAELVKLVEMTVAITQQMPNKPV